MSMVIHLTLLTLFVFYGEINAGKAWKRIVYQSFGDCSNRPNDTLLISTNLYPRVRGPKIFINGNVTVKANLPRDLNFELVSSKCHLQTKKCEFSANDTLPSFCKLLAIKNPLTSNVKPTLRCPIKKGVYEVKDSIFSMESVMAMPIENQRWTVQFRVISAVKGDKNKELGCAVLVGDILPPN